MISITVLELAIYGMNLLLNITDLSFNFFLYHRLLPTIALNVVFYIVVSFPLKNYFGRRENVPILILYSKKRYFPSTYDLFSSIIEENA
jgi:hypothetical protein